MKKKTVQNFYKSVFIVFQLILSNMYAESDSSTVKSDTLKMEAEFEPDFEISGFEDLGFSQEAMAIDTNNFPSSRRIKMLGWHQRLGLATAGLMTATLITGRDGEVTQVHKALGISTGLFYYTTAGFSLFAPKPKVKKESGNIVLHKYLAWIHGTSMLLAPVLGWAAAQKLEDNNEPDKGLNNPEGIWDFMVANHGNVVRMGYYSFMAAMFVMVIEF